MMTARREIVIVGGGAAGFFAAIHVARLIPEAHVSILEKSTQVLGKVRISGGGRCNVTHACFDNRALISNYPRGGKSLLGPFSRFTTTDTISWFETEGVQLKTEDDGRMFPVTDDSSTIISALMEAAMESQVNIRYGCGVAGIAPNEGQWEIDTGTGKVIADALIIASGSSPAMWKVLEGIGVSVIPPVPSLFTFHVREKALNDLSGVSVDKVRIRLEGTKLQTEGPLLITHFGFSGPAALKLSAFAARELAAADYQGRLNINFLPEMNLQEVTDLLLATRVSQSRKLPRNSFLFAGISRRCWEFLISRSGISNELNLGDVSNKQLNKLASELCNGQYTIVGKSTFKEEFVTCGGVDLDEIDLRTMQSKKYPGMFFAGEVVNVDAVTGGFNFQWAWTSGFIAAEGARSRLLPQQ